MTNAKGEVWTAALLRERTARQLKRKMGAFLGHGKSDDKVRSSVASYTGWLGWCDGQGLYDKYMRPVKEMEAKRC